VNQPADLPGVLAAAFDEFEALRRDARIWEDQGQELFLAFAMAGSAAADGRDAVVSAPVFPPGPGQDIASPQYGGPEPAADSMAARAAALAARLGEAAGLAVAGPDRDACRQAASAARRIRELLAGAGARDSR
jgi:hypothetical protein